jgi:hypothetical protein
MSISRRIFLRGGTIVVLGAAAQSALGKVALAQMSRGGVNTVRGFRLPNGSTGDPLAYYNRATFLAHLNEKFQLRMGNSSWEVKLAQVIDFKGSQTNPIEGGECFSLVFSGAKQLSQGTYDVEHTTLGAFKLFLVPSGKVGGTTQSDAVINRLNS